MKDSGWFYNDENNGKYYDDFGWKVNRKLQLFVVIPEEHYHNHVIVMMILPNVMTDVSI